MAPFPSSDDLVHASSCSVNNKDFSPLEIRASVRCSVQGAMEEPPYINKKQTLTSLWGYDLSLPL